MARGREVPRGGTDPTFTPTVGVVQPTIQQQFQETPIQQLERVLLTAAGLGATALQTAAAAKKSRDTLREGAVARQNILMNQVVQGQVTQQHSMQQIRLEDAGKKATDILIRSADHDPAWLVRQARLQMVNAPSSEEAELWQAFFIEARDAAERVELDDAKRRQIDIVNQFALAGHTADNAIKALGDRLKLDLDLQSELIGDGTGIHDRVQDWALREAQRVAPELFDIDSRDPDRELKIEQRDAIVVQLIRSSLPVANRLIEQHGTDMEQAASSTGVQLVTSQLTSFFKGDISIEAMTESINDAGTLHFNHLSSTEREAKFKQVVSTAMDAALKGRFGFDIGRLEPRLKSLIDSGPFSDFEKAILRGSIQEGLSQLAVGQYGALVTKERLMHTIEVPVPTSDGSLAFRSVVHPDALIAMAAVGVDGRTVFDRIATQAIIEAGLDRNADDMTPIELAAVARILDSATEFNVNGQRARAGQMVELENVVRVFSGDPAGDPRQAYESSIARRVFSTSRPLGPNQIQKILEVEAAIRATKPDLQDALKPEQVWDSAKPMERSVETRTLREAVWVLEARAWADERVRSAHPLPANMISEMSTFWTQGGPEEMIDVLFFASALTDIRREELLSGLGDGSAAALSLRIAMHEQLLAANNIQFQPPLDDLMATARAAQQVSAPSDFLSSATPFIDNAGSLNREVAAAAFAEILAGKKLSSIAQVFNKILPGNPFVNADKVYNVNMSNIQAQFMGPAKPIVDRMLELWSMRVQTTDDTPVEAAHFVDEMKKADGYHWANIDGEMTIVQDPQFHFGPDDPRGLDLQIGVNRLMQQPLKDWQRDVLVAALDIAPPNTLADLYFLTPDLVNPQRIQDERGNRLPIDFVISDGTNRDAQFTLRKDAIEFGGVTLQGRDPTNPQRMFPTIRAKRSVTYTGPDGQEHIIQAGEPLLVYSFHMLDFQGENNPPFQFTDILADAVGLPQRVPAPIERGFRALVGVPTVP